LFEGFYEMSKKKTAQEKYPEFMDDQRQFFDELISDEWETYENPEWDKLRQFEVARLFEKVNPKRILDVGCGCGYHDLLMAQRNEVVEIVGVDYSPKSIETANRVYPHSKISRIAADIREFPAGQFDMAVSFQVIEHLRDAEEFINACAKQVKSGGWVAIATPNRRRMMNMLLQAVGRPATLADPQHFLEYSPEEMKRIGEKAGLKYHDSFGYGMSIYLPRLGRMIPPSLGLRMGNWMTDYADCFCIIFTVI
jgi:2-polyprenyl-3-methyl-5-hydroxy-6-metoxy-1,4-benzoquinol methylase